MNLDGIQVLSCEIQCPDCGQGTVKLWLDDHDAVAQLLKATTATLLLEDQPKTTLVGHIVSAASQAFGDTGTIVMTFGAGLPVSTVLPAKSYHTPSGVLTKTVVQDVLTELGFELGLWLPPKERLGPHYTREKGEASLTLDSCLGRTWRIGLDGKLHCGQYPEQFPTYDLNSFDAAIQHCTVQLDQARDMRGQLISEVNRTVTNCTITADSEGIRADCYLGELDLANVLRSFIRREIRQLVVPPQICKVVTMQADGRVQVKALDESTGTPDLIAVDQWGGAGGVHTELSIGQEVVVQWIGHDRTRPIITQYAPKTSPNHDAQKVVFNGSIDVAARVGDSVSVGPFEGQLITLGEPGATGPVSLGTPVPFVFSGVSPLDPTQLHGVVDSSDSKVRL